MPDPAMRWTYLYSRMFTPTESAAPGFSPTARRRRPVLVKPRYHHTSTAMTTPK